MRFFYLAIIHFSDICSDTFENYLDLWLFKILLLKNVCETVTSPEDEIWGDQNRDSPVFMICLFWTVPSNGIIKMLSFYTAVSHLVYFIYTGALVRSPFFVVLYLLSVYIQLFPCECTSACVCRLRLVLCEDACTRVFWEFGNCRMCCWDVNSSPHHYAASALTRWTISLSLHSFG